MNHLTQYFYKPNRKDIMTDKKQRVQAFMDHFHGLMEILINTVDDDNSTPQQLLTKACDRLIEITGHIKQNGEEFFKVEKVKEE